MTRKTTLFAVILMFMAAMPAMAQKFYEVKDLNISLQAPVKDGWASYVSSLLDNNNALTGKIIAVEKKSGVKYVRITCQYKAMEVETLITKMASDKSLQAGFEYMSIEKVKNAKVAKEKAKFLAFSNNYLNEAFVGGIYGLVKDGYTYTIEYYTEDNPSDIKLIEKILASIRIYKPEAIAPTIVKTDEHFAPKEAKSDEQLNNMSEKEAKKLAKEEKKAEEKRKKEIKEQKKAAKKQIKELGVQEKKEAEALKAQEKQVKEQKKALKAEKKATKERKKQIQQQKKEIKKAAKEL